MTGQFLGDFSGPAVEHVELTFGYFGHTFRVHPVASDLELIEFMTADGVDDDTPDEFKAMQSFARYLRKLVHPDDFAEFWETAKANGQGLNDLMVLGTQIEAAVANFRTGQQGDSSPGQPTTPQKSKAASSPRPRRTPSSKTTPEQRLAEQRETAATEVFERFGSLGRPDLQQIVVDASNGRQALTAVG